MRLDGAGSGIASGATASGGSGEPSPGGPADPELAQFLEDERMAIFLQNEEFMRELRRNKDFMSSLDSGQAGGHKGDDSQAHMHDDAVFRFVLNKTFSILKDESVTNVRQIMSENMINGLVH